MDEVAAVAERRVLSATLDGDEPALRRQFGWFGWLMMLAVWVLFIVGVVWLVRNLGGLMM